MFNLSILLLSEIAFCLVAVIKKQWRNNNISADAIWASYIYLVPFFALTGLIAYSFVKVNFSLEYFIILALWLTACTTHNLIRIYLYRFQSLSEFLAFDFFFSTLLMYSIDIFYFSYEFSIGSLAGVFLVLIGSTVLYQRQKPIENVVEEATKRLSLKHLLGSFIVLTLITAFSTTMSKQAVSMQDPIFHGAFANALLFLVFWLIGYKKMGASIQAGSMKRTTIYLSCLAMFVGSLAEAWAFKMLPLTLISMAGIFVPLTFYGVHDFYRAEIQFNIINVIAFLTILSGFSIYITAVLL